MLTGLVMVPLMLNYLGPLEYGIWLTLQSILAFTAFADFGIGNGAMNAITAAHAQGRRDDVNRILSTAIVMLTAIGVAVLVVVLAVWPLAPWARLLRLEAKASFGDVSTGIAVCAVYFAIALPLAFVDKVTTAFQEGNIAHWARIAAALLSLAAVWAASQLGGSFATICAATLAPAALCWVWAWWYVVITHRWLRLSFLNTSIAETLQTLHRGSLFFALQVCALVGFSLDNLFIAAALGPESVAGYAVPYRLFTVVFLLAGIILNPLWPAYADAHALGDHKWIRQAFFRSLVATLAVSTTAATVLALFLTQILHLWVGDSITVSPVMTVGLVAFTVLHSIGTVFSTLWNGTSTLRLQLVLGVVFTIVGVPAKLIAMRLWGLDWLPIASAAAYMFTTLLPAIASMLRSGDNLGHTST
jgi:O-antigen/teichoic acid export membrane protein